MDNQTLRQIGDAIQKNKTIGIVTAQNPSLDEMGAALALYLSLVQVGKSVAIATPENPLVEVSSLVGIDKVKTALTGESGDLTVSFPYQEGEIEKVSYTLENGLLNIVVKAGEKGLSFEEKEVSFTRAQGVPNLLFAVGVPRLSDLGKLFDIAGLKDTMIVNIDNKAENQGFGDIIMVYPMLSSISEQVANLIISLNLRIDIDIAQNLMYGISQATNNFQDVKTSALAFEMVAILMKNGAIRVSSKKLQSESANTEQFFPKPASRNQNTQVSQFASKPTAKQQEPEKEVTNENPPEDWLAPKIYKGSTNF
jgi:nanoRNase/pAp phosphatase (c-di-AMP/oligoRNAs hydrolase)